MSNNRQEIKEYALKTINKLYRRDPWIRQLYYSAGITMEDVANRLDELLDNVFFDTASNSGTANYEKDLGIKAEGSLVDRRKRVAAKWQQSGKLDLDKIRALVKVYVLDDIDVLFENGRLKLVFNNSNFVYALPNIRTDMDEVKPAHIGVEVADVHAVEGDLYAGCYITTSSIISIEPNVGISTELDDAEIVACVYISKSSVIHDIY